MQINFPDKFLTQKIKSLSKNKELLDYLGNLSGLASDFEYSKHESSIALPLDKKLLKESFELTNKRSNKKLKYIFLIGIGGSNLGTKAVYDFLFLRSEPEVKILFFDTLSERYLLDFQENLKQIKSKDEFEIVLVSKSGKTTESLVNFELLFSTLKTKFKDFSDRVVVITDKNSPLDNEVKGKFDVLHIPKMVGGRFSVFSPVGIYPLLLAGVDVSSLISGAAKISKNINDYFSYLMLYASFLFNYKNSGFSILNLFVFDPYLETLGKWFIQLYAESLGKKLDKSGKVVHEGFSPMVSVGTTDLHSLGQLFFEGPNDKISILLNYLKRKSKFKLNKKTVLSLSSDFSSFELSEVSNAIYEGVKRNYQKENLPFIEFLLDLPNLKSIGEFMQFHMIAVMLLGEFLNVNAFNQPGVEFYKKESKKILKEKRL